MLNRNVAELRICAADLLFRAKVSASCSCADDADYFGRPRIVCLPNTTNHQKPRPLTGAQGVSRMLFERQVGKWPVLAIDRDRRARLSRKRFLKGWEFSQLGGG